MSKQRTASSDTQEAQQHRSDDTSDHGNNRPVRGTERIAVGKQRRLIGQERYIHKGFTGYNFLEDRVPVALRGGYEFCKHEGTGENIYTQSGAGKLVLMQIPTDLWQEDQKAKHKNAVDAMAEAAKIDLSKGEYGENDSSHSVQVKGTGTDPLFDS